MAKLYPPILEDTIPACYEENGVVKITIPFSMNKSVSISQIGGFELKIKTIQSGSYLYTIKTLNSSQYSITDSECYVTFYLNDIDKKLKIGQFYRIQLAYIFVDEVLKNQYYSKYLLNQITLLEYEQKIAEICVSGYYSTSSIIKYTTKPSVYINNFKIKGVNNYTHEYIGYYDQSNGDVTEKVYSYCFNIYDKNKTLILTSNENIHNSTNDTNPEISFDKYLITSDLKYDTIYYVEYLIKTINNLEIKSPLYKMIQRETIQPNISAKIKIESNFEDGYIDIILVPEEDYFFKRAVILYNQSENKKWIENSETIQEKGFTKNQANVILANKDSINNINSIKLQNTLKTISKNSGSFILTRSDEDSNFSNWEPLYKFKLYKETPSGLIFRDYTVEQGKKYQYSIQQYNDYGLFSKRLYSDFVISDFEDAFLFDGKRQLKIRYNTKIKKFANTVLESKQETIGNKYPYIFRNSNVSYNEFSISGLISYLMDNNNLFLSFNDLDNLYRQHTKNNLSNESCQKIENKNTDYTTNNIMQERLFKMEVLKWLNNGMPKLFRSPTEGNFIVKLMKISLTPQEKLGRLLHTFNCSACEIADCTNKNLQELNIINIKDIDNYIFQSKTINLSDYTSNNIISLNIPSGALIKFLHFENMRPGDIINLIKKDESKMSVFIGSTRTLHLDNVPLDVVSFYVEPRFKEIFNLNANEYQYNKTKYYTYKNGEYVQETNDSIYNRLSKYYTISNLTLEGLITYGYSLKQDNSFDYIKQVYYEDAIVRQFIGQHDILHEIQHIKSSDADLKGIKDIKSELIDLCYIKVTKRPIDQIITNYLNKTNLKDSNEFFYGALNSEGENRSERFPLIELMYPVGLRAYKPNTFFIMNNNNELIKDQSLNFDNSKKYYLKGQYQKTIYPVGLVAYEPGVFYTKVSTEKEEFQLCTDLEWKKDLEYYIEIRNLKGAVSYRLVEYMTGNANYVFIPNKFYRTTGKLDDEGKDIYTLSKKFIPEFYDNEQYYELNENLPGQVDAYVTTNENYVYKPYEYYIHIINKRDKTDRYLPAEALEYNINEIELSEYEEIEYDVNYDKNVIKYYKMKDILPHILHQVGVQWIELKTNETAKPGYVDNINHSNQLPLYKFIPIKYRDFYNNTNYKIEEYNPSITINGNNISVDDTIIFKIDDLRNFGKITELISGNGVVVDIIYNIKKYEYIIEDSLGSKENYLKAIDNLNEYINYLVLDSTDENYVNLSDINDKLYNDYYNKIPHKEVQNRYYDLIQSIHSAIGEEIKR